jgi:hypothetical protein
MHHEIETFCDDGVLVLRLGTKRAMYCPDCEYASPDIDVVVSVAPAENVDSNFVKMANAMIASGVCSQQETEQIHVWIATQRNNYNAP